jgi:parallel beta-helix repeat protein
MKKLLKIYLSFMALALGLMLLWSVDADSSTEEELIVLEMSEQESLEASAMPGRVAGMGTLYLQVTDSIYENVSVESSEPVNLSVESVPELITIEIAPAGDATSTVITIEGLQPLKPYFKYEDNYHNRSQVDTDENGVCSYVQDITQKHIVFIQPRPSTKFIPSDTDIGIWDPVLRVYTLTADVGETVQIDEDNLTLDGAGHSIIGYDTGHGIYLADRTGVEVTNLNISDFSNGLYVYNCTDCTISYSNSTSNAYGAYIKDSSNITVLENTMDDNLYGIYLTTSSNNTVEDNTANLNGYKGIYLNTQCNDNVIWGNTADSNVDHGIMLTNQCNYNELTCNTLSSNESGIEVYNGAYNSIGGNSANANLLYGINLSYTSYDNDVIGNVLSNNFRGLYLGQYSNDNEIYNNNFIGNTTQASVYSGTINSFSAGNHWSDWTEPDANADGFVDAPYAIDSGAQDGLPLVNPLNIQCDQPPVAEAGIDVSALIGDTVILDGSASYDSGGLSLTYYWSFVSVPGGSTAQIFDETLEQAYFVPDVSGDYVVSLVVSNGILDSLTDEVTITASSAADAAILKLYEAIDCINDLPKVVFLRSSSGRLLVSKIEGGIEQIGIGDYAGAYSYLDRFVLSKVDGCQKGGDPDRTDLIISCPEQEEVYILISEAMDLIPN